MRTHNTGVVSSILPCVTLKTPSVRKATGNHLVNSISLEKLRALSLVSAKLEIEYATQQQLPTNYDACGNDFTY